MAVKKEISVKETTKHLARDWQNFYKQNNYYHTNLQLLAQHLIPDNASVIEFGSYGGELLNSLPNKVKTGMVMQDEFIKLAKKKYPRLNIRKLDQLKWENKKKYDYILLSHVLSEVGDVQKFVSDIKEYSHEETRIVVFSFNYLWKPVLDVGEILGLKRPQSFEPNWLSEGDIDNFFYLEGYDKVKSGKKFLMPYNLPIISGLLNKYISPLPIVNNLSLINYAIYKLRKKPKDYSVSIIVPARNEEGSMHGIFKKMPRFTKNLEIVFVEGHSKDRTYETINKEIAKYKGPFKGSLYKQKGKGKGDAVRIGFSKAKNDLLMILDADLTVDPSELPKFYKAFVEDRGELVMGSRLVYPMEKQAMRALNVLGNKFFSVAFTFLLDQRIKDTLCGTKVLLKKDYEKIAKNRKVFGEFDPFGDYDLIFGAAKLNLKITEIPIRYKERTYGTTNISRFSHGLLLLKMVGFAARKMKFI